MANWLEFLADYAMGWAADAFAKIDGGVFVRVRVPDIERLAPAHNVLALAGAVLKDEPAREDN